MSVKDGKLLWHLTALANIESIFQNGLLCRKKLITMSFVDIADKDILDSRARFGLENYIPFHFMQKTPFAGRVMKDNKDKEFIYITLHRDFAKANNFKIINKHPLCEDSQIYDYDEGMANINWELIDCDNRDYTNHSIRESCMAECIGIYESISAKCFQNIYTNSEETKAFIESLKKKYNLDFYVNFNPKLFV